MLLHQIDELSATGTRAIVFTTEYSVRTAIEAVDTLLSVERGVPEVFGSTYDVRELLQASSVICDGEKVKVPKSMRKHLFGNEMGTLLNKYNVI